MLLQWVRLLKSLGSLCLVNEPNYLLLASLQIHTLILLLPIPSTFKWHSCYTMHVPWICACMCLCVNGHLVQTDLRAHEHEAKSFSREAVWLYLDFSLEYFYMSFLQCTMFIERKWINRTRQQTNETQKYFTNIEVQIDYVQRYSA